MDVKKFYGKRFHNLSAATDYIESSDRSHFDFAIIPPNTHCDTDEEDIEEDNILRDDIPRDVPGEVDLFLSSDSDSDDDIPLASLQKRQKLSKDLNPKWRKRITSAEIPETHFYEQSQLEACSLLVTKNPVEIFETIFDDEVVKLIIDQTKIYALQHNKHDFCFNEEDLKIFIGILLYSGYHSMPRERMYWQLDEDTRTPFIANNMSRNRFQEIKQFLHLTDNSNLDFSDKMAKIRPLSQILCKKFCQFGYMHQKLSVDESMVRYFGSHSAKQFIRGKPVRFGFKNWMITSSCGYLYEFDTYCGAKTVERQKESLPLGSRVVLDLLANIPHPTDHIVFFDNFFTSYDLLRILKEQGFKATGTVRERRTKKCPLKTNKELQKKQRGEFDFMCSDSGILFVKWNDNSVVTVGTNFDRIEPLHTVKRWSRQERCKVNAHQPKLIAEYNSGMGGVDLHDQALNTYNIKFRGKKWWWPLFTTMISSCVVNAWKLYKMASKSQCDLLQYQREIVRFYLRNYNIRDISSKRSTTASIAGSSYNHFPKRISNQLRCRECHQRIRWICELCNVALCVERECFKNFHTVNRTNNQGSL